MLRQSHASHQCPLENAYCDVYLLTCSTESEIYAKMMEDVYFDTIQNEGGEDEEIADVRWQSPLSELVHKNEGCLKRAVNWDDPSKQELIVDGKWLRDILPKLVDHIQTLRSTMHMRDGPFRNHGCAIRNVYRDVAFSKLVDPDDVSKKRLLPFDKAMDVMTHRMTMFSLLSVQQSIIRSWREVPENQSTLVEVHVPGDHFFSEVLHIQGKGRWQDEGFLIGFRELMPLFREFYSFLCYGNTPRGCDDDMLVDAATDP